MALVTGPAVLAATALAVALAAAVLALWPAIPLAALAFAISAAELRARLKARQIASRRNRRGGFLPTAQLRETEAVTHDGLAGLYAAKESGLLTPAEEAEADELIEEGLALHRAAAVRREHADAMNEALVARDSGDEARMRRAVARLGRANAELEALRDAKEADDGC